MKRNRRGLQFQEVPNDELRNRKKTGLDLDRRPGNRCGGPRHVRRAGIRKIRIPYIVQQPVRDFRHGARHVQRLPRIGADHLESLWPGLQFQRLSFTTHRRTSIPTAMDSPTARRSPRGPSPATREQARAHRHDAAHGEFHEPGRGRNGGAGRRRRDGHVQRGGQIGEHDDVHAQGRAPPPWPAPWASPGRRRPSRRRHRWPTARRTPRRSPPASRTWRTTPSPPTTSGPSRRARRRTPPRRPSAPRSRPATRPGWRSTPT